MLAEISTNNHAGQPIVGRPMEFSGVSCSASRKLLVIDYAVPQYDRDAGARSSFLYLELLRSEGHEVFFMPNDQLRREPYASMLEAIGVQLLIGTGFRCGGWRRWLAAQPISHVILHRPNVARRYVTEIKKCCRAKIIYFAHDLRFVRECRHYEVTGDVFHRKEAEYWKGIERSILSQVDAAYFFSEEEIKIVSGWELRGALRYVPLFPGGAGSSNTLPFEERSGLLFVGGFAHQPNLDGVLWFAKEVFPRVQRAIPELTWHIVGREPPSEVKALGKNGVVVEGGVSEARLDELYRTCAVAVAPLRFGAGVKGKVVEAMSRNIPVVTTPIGAEGIRDANAALRVADSAEDMADLIIRLCQDPAAWKQARADMAEAIDKNGYAEVVEILNKDLRI